jgi:hypothetical protein
MRLGSGRSAALLAAITNFPEPSDDPSRPSRGFLCEAALLAEDAGRAVEAILEEVAARRRNGFQMFVADPDRAYALRGGEGDLEAKELEPGVHTLTNLHRLDRVRVPESATWIDERSPATALWTAIPAVLADHARRPPDGQAFCKHLGDRGTVSSAILGAPRDGVAVFRFAAGPPCTSRFTDAFVAG